jgi:hypothetical protein
VPREDEAGQKLDGDSKVCLIYSVPGCFLALVLVIEIGWLCDYGWSGGEA